MNRKRKQLLLAGEESRSSQRFSTRDFGVEFPICAAVIDISESGMGIESSKQLRVGSSYVFRIRMGPKSFGMPGKVEWCRFAGTSGMVGADPAALYKAGISFPAGPARQSWGTALERLVESGIEPMATPSVG